jgi:DNA-binding CsgD family transcriptional regulator
MPDPEIGLKRALSAFHELRATALDDLLVPGAITLLRSPPTQQPEFHTRLRPPGNAASNHFFHRIRLRTPKVGVPSAWQKWHDRSLRLKVFRRLLRLKKVDYINNATIRLALHMTGATPAQFKPGVAKAIYELTEAKRVLDFSMGWGDRLAGFCASSGTHYIGCDPNADLHQGYQDMIRAYGQGKTITTLGLPAEEMRFERDQFDLVFSSPPYFGMELYAHGTPHQGAQSWARYPTPESWVSGFLRPTLEHAWHALAPGGVLAINIADVIIRRGKIPLCAWTQEAVSALPGATFQYALGMRLQGANYSDDRRQQVSGEPIWIWTKGSRELPRAVEQKAYWQKATSHCAEQDMSGKTSLDLNQLATLAAAGNHPDELAAVLGCHPSSVIQQLHNQGIEWKRKDDARRSLTLAQEAELIKRYLANEMGATKLSREYGVDKGTVYNILKRHRVGTFSVASRRTPHRLKGCQISERDLLIKQLREGGKTYEQIAKIAGVSAATVLHSLKKQGCMPVEERAPRIASPSTSKNKGLGKGNRAQPLDRDLRHDAFDALDEKSMYWLGFLLADGCVYTKGVYGQPTITLQLQRGDKNHLEKFKSWIGTNRAIIDGKHWSFEKWHEHSALSFRSARIAARLNELGIVNHKVGRFISTALSDSKDFWRGVMDGDGSIYTSNQSGIAYISGQLPIVRAWGDYCTTVVNDPECVRYDTNQNGVHRGWIRFRWHGRIILPLLYSKATVFLQRKMDEAMTWFVDG